VGVEQVVLWKDVRAVLDINYECLDNFEALNVNLPALILY
jgi:hypothetical protein